MKKLIIAALLVVSITTFAQGKRGLKADRENLTSEQKVDLQVKRLTVDLTLTEKQVKEVRELVAKKIDKREAKRTEKVALQEKKKEERKAMFEKRKVEMEQEQAKVAVEMKKILTPEQFVKWNEMKAQNKENRAEKRRDKMTDRKMKKQNKN